jgi:hypothetical protein
VVSLAITRIVRAVEISKGKSKNEKRKYAQ